MAPAVSKNANQSFPGLPERILSSAKSVIPGANPDKVKVKLTALTSATSSPKSTLKSFPNPDQVKEFQRRSPRPVHSLRGVSTPPTEKMPSYRIAHVLVGLARAVSTPEVASRWEAI